MRLIAAWLGVIVLGGAMGACANNRPASSQPAGALLGGENSLKDPTYIESAANLKTRKLLEASGDCVAANEKFETVIESIRKQSGASIYVNWKALEAAGIDKPTPVELNLVKVPFKKILSTLLAEIGGGAAALEWTIDDGVVTVSTKDDLNSAKYQVVRVYDIGLILDTIDPAELTDWIVVTNHSSFIGGFSSAPRSPETQQHEIVEAIKDTIAPESWRDAGGQIGSLRAAKGLLIVNQTVDNQREIAKLINDMRDKAQARTRIYDVRDLVGTDDRKLRELMDLIEGLSPQRMWVEKGGAMAVMRGMDGYLYVSGAKHVHEEMEMQLKAIRATGVHSRKMNLVTPTLSPAPPQMSPPPAPATSSPAPAPK